jgi:hypothetical protein
MRRADDDYLNNDSEKKRIIRTEVLFTPFLVVVPMVVAVFLILDWYYRGFSQGSSAYDGEIIVGVIMLVANIVFEIPFVRSLVRYNRDFFKDK